MPVQTRTIHSRNADYQRFQVLKTNRNKRYRYGEFFVEGVRNLNAAVRFGWHISSLLYPAGLRICSTASRPTSTMR